MKTVVLAPDVFVRALRDPGAQAVLRAWRDGHIRPVVSWELGRRCVTGLRQAGVPPHLLRRWLWWLTSHARSDYRGGQGEPGVPLRELCERLAELGEAEAVLTCAMPRPDSGLWIPAEDLLSSLPAGRARR